MRRILMGLAMAGILAGTLSFAQEARTPKQMLKDRQKQENKILQQKVKNEKQMMKNGDISKALRTQMKHELAREKRQLKEKQKDERQELKDRQRIMKEGANNASD
jgi:gas vesicle protein